MDIDLLCCLGIDDIRDQCKPKGWRYDENNTCDEKILKYCNDNPYDEACSCINSKEKFPQCQDLKCQKTGYQTNNMRQTKCPNITTCNQIIKDVAIDNSSVNTQQFQICAGDPDIAEKLKAYEVAKNNPNPIPKANSDSSSGSSSSSDFFKNPYIIIILLLLILIIGIAIYVVYTKNKKQKQNYVDLVDKV